MRSAQIVLRLAEHPAPSFVAAQRIQDALRTQPPHTVATAARLVSQIIYDLTHKRAVRCVAIELAEQPRGITISVTASGAGLTSGWKLDGLARLLLDRLAAHWGEDAQHNRIWFQLSSPAQASRCAETAS